MLKNKNISINILLILLVPKYIYSNANIHNNSYLNIGTHLVSWHNQIIYQYIKSFFFFKTGI